MDSPPAQDSPKNILNALNNYCLQKIFRRLESPEDLLNIARTCTRFQENAKSGFGFGMISIGDYWFERERGAYLPMKHVIGFLSNFGHLIKELEWRASRNTKINIKVADAIARFCSRTLIELIIMHYHSKFPKQFGFKFLQRLTLVDASPKQFKAHSR